MRQNGMTSKILRGKMSLMLAVLLVVQLLVPSLMVNVSAEADSTAPVVESVEVSPQETGVGDTITIKAKVTDDISGVDRVYVYHHAPSYNSTSKYKDVILKYDSVQDLWVGSYQVEEYDENGTWSFYRVYTRDYAGNQTSVYDSDLPNPGSRDFIVEAADDDKTAPVVESIEVSPQEATAGDTVTIKAKVSDDNSGVDRVYVYHHAPSYSSTSKYKDAILEYDSVQDLWVGTYQIENYDENGVWQFYRVYTRDYAGNQTSVYDSDLSNPGSRDFTVGHVNSDTTPPVVESIKISPQEVHPGDTVTIKAKVSDDNSGTDRVYVYHHAPSYSSTSKYKDVILRYDSVQDLWIGSYQIEDYDENGTWSFYRVYTRDSAGNQLSVYDSDFPDDGSRDYTVSPDTTAPSAPTVNDITEHDTAVTGTAEAGSSVTVSTDTEVLGTGQAGTDGRFDVMIAKQVPNTVLFVTATDLAGNKSEAASVTVKDATPPAKPAVNEVTEHDTLVTGTAEASSSVTVIAGTEILGTAKAGADGKFSITIASQMPNTILSVTARDAAGNESEAASVTVQDVTAPLQPEVNEVTDQSFGITGTAEVDSVVKVMAGSTLLGSGQAGSDGNFNIEIPQQQAETVLDVTARDAAGNESEAVKVIVTDVTAPPKPEVNKVTDQDTEVSGISEAGAVITVKIANNVLGTVKVGIDGDFRLTISKQSPGTILEVSAVDAVGNESEPTNIAVTDGTAPLTPDVEDVTERDTVLNGKSEGNAVIVVMSGEDVLGTANAGSDGSFSVLIPKQPAGTLIAVTAEDEAGNKSEAAVLTVLEVEEFKDLASVKWAEESIYYLTSKGIISGIGNGNFAPNDKITRAQAAALLVRHLYPNEQVNVNPNFNDVSVNHYFYKDIAMAVEHGIFSGYPGNVFKPNEPITRAATAAILSNAYKVKQGGNLVDFKDLNEVSWAKESIIHLASNKLVNGYQDQTFRPSNLVTRAEFAAMMTNVLKYKE